MQIDLTGRTALVTGSTAGIGEAIATGLAAAGAEVVVNGRTEERVAAAVARIAETTGAGARLRRAPGDIGTVDGAAAVVDAVNGGIDVLVLNAGVFTPTPIFEITDDDWREVFEVNVLGGVRLARAVVPGMVERGWGRVIHVSSESALHIPAEMVHYGVSKTAQLAVSRGMAESLPVGGGVTVNAILPGPTHTEGVEGMLEQMAAEQGIDTTEAGRRFVAAERPTSLLGRLIEPAEVANLAVYLASEQASATTGAALRVDGGVVRAAFG